MVAVGEEAELKALAVLVEDVNGMLPGIELGDVEFAQVEHLALDDAVAAEAQTFANGIVDVGLAVLGAEAPFEKHAESLPPTGSTPARGQVGAQAFWPKPLLSFNHLHAKKSENRQTVRRCG